MAAPVALFHLLPLFHQDPNRTCLSCFGSAGSGTLVLFIFLYCRARFSPSSILIRLANLFDSCIVSWLRMKLSSIRSRVYTHHSRLLWQATLRFLRSRVYTLRPSAFFLGLNLPRESFWPLALEPLNPPGVCMFLLICLLCNCIGCDVMTLLAVISLCLR